MTESSYGSISAIVKAGLRSIAASIPVAASIGQAWNEYDAYKTGVRITELMDDVKLELERLKHTARLHEDLIAMALDEAPSLIEIAIEKVRKEFEREKRRMYARLLARMLNKGNTESYAGKVSVLHNLDTLTTKDLQVLRLFRDKPEVMVGDLAWQSLGLSGDQEEQLAQLAGHFGKLDSRGLIVQMSAVPKVMYKLSGMSDWAARWQETRYRLLPSGKAIIEGISE